MKKRNAYEYDIILDNLHHIVRFPDNIYKNSDVKRSDFIFMKEINGESFASAIKMNAHPEVGQPITVVISAFKTKPNYLGKFELIRSWKGGIPSS